MRAVLAVLIGKLLRFAVRIIRPGGGSALPGLVANRIAPGLLGSALHSLPMGLVVVSGSAGKSSTTHYLVSLLQVHGLRVFTNNSTANIRRGLVASVLKEASLLGRLDYDIAVLELDEGHGAKMADELDVSLALLTNVLSDQLDRFNDPADVILMLEKIGSVASKVVLNADDKNLTQLNCAKNAVGFGILDENERSGLFEYALNFGEHGAVNMSVIATPQEVRITAQGLSFDFPDLPAYQRINVAGAVAALYEIISPDEALVQQVLSNLKPVFARNEPVVVKGVPVQLKLVQNPSSFQLNLGDIQPSNTPLMLMAGSDIHDPSWLWTVDFSKLEKVEVVGGRNAAALALRLMFAGIEVQRIEADPLKAADAFLNLPGSNHTILFSADAMRRVRRHWGLAK
ncbi:MAG: MurT ligase domain-containing protein [Aquiluna sp.]|nr:MurT ligase domain-containing protein [Aquiluna sp.]